MGQKAHWPKVGDAHGLRASYGAHIEPPGPPLRHRSCVGPIERTRGRVQNCRPDIQMHVGQPVLYAPGAGRRMARRAGQSNSRRTVGHPNADQTTDPAPLVAPQTVVSGSLTGSEPDDQFWSELRRISSKRDLPERHQGRIVLGGDLVSGWKRERRERIRHRCALSIQLCHRNWPSRWIPLGKPVPVPRIIRGIVVEAKARVRVVSVDQRCQQHGSTEPGVVEVWRPVDPSHRREQTSCGHETRQDERPRRPADCHDQPVQTMNP